MKRLLLILSLAVLTTSYSYAKPKSPTEAAKKEIKANADKDSRKSAKAMEKDGWQSMAGRLTLEKQIEQAKVAEATLDADGNKTYLIGTHVAVGGNYSAAKNIANTRAKAELATQLKTRIKSDILDKNSNKQLSPKDIKLLDETIAVVVENADVSMQGVNNLMEAYRNIDGGKCEVTITLGVKADALVKQALAKIDKQMAKKSDMIIK